MFTQHLVHISLHNFQIFVTKVSHFLGLLSLSVRVLQRNRTNEMCVHDSYGNFTRWNWLVWLWKVRMIVIFSLHTGFPGKPYVCFHPRSEAQELDVQRCLSQGVDNDLSQHSETESNVSLSPLFIPLFPSMDEIIPIHQFRCTPHTHIQRTLLSHIHLVYKSHHHRVIHSTT